VKKLLLVTTLAFVVSGCATPLSSAQKRDMKFYQSKGLVVEEKNPGTAAGLGLLPGFGSFYVREYGAGIVNLLFWPASILWDPVSGYDGANVINYYATKDAISRKQKREIKNLEDSVATGKTPQADYIKLRREIEDKYTPDAAD